MNKKIDTKTLYKYKEELEQEIQDKEKTRVALEAKVQEREVAFRKGKVFTETLKNAKRKTFSFLRAVPAYLLRRRNPKKLYSKSYKQKDASNQLKKITTYLYSQGMEERAINDLVERFNNPTHKYVRKAAAWELSLWYANKLNPETAEWALYYLEHALLDEKDPERLRRGAILQAESYELLGRQEEGKKVIQKALKTERHPDLYLALANQENTVEASLQAINQTFEWYHLAPISLKQVREEEQLYNRITVEKTLHRETTGPKVTIIIPAYNAAEGIGNAIESLLEQTYKNIEIIAVDDCSTDETVNVIETYAAKDSRVHILSTPKNSGPYIARNIALEHATGELVTINDADDWSHPEKIVKQVQDFEDNPTRIANTSEHARVTENLKLYRRGMPGSYIFTNMSSLMFRREPIQEKIGYWDSVRFAADGEFIKRIQKVFGQDSVRHLQTGPLSLPMQSAGSLTGSSAFGYNGFLKGARKEYAESQAVYHEQADSLYMPYPQEERAFPVPEPMWPQLEVGKNEARPFEFIIVADFRKELTEGFTEFIKNLKAQHVKIGLVQMGTYDAKIQSKIHSSTRKVIDGQNIQLLVYGEKARCDILIVVEPGIFEERQKYRPSIQAKIVHVLVTEIRKEKAHSYRLRHCARNIESYGKTTSTWYPLNQTVREELLEHYRRDLRSIRLSKENWLIPNQEAVAAYVDDWLLTEENPFH